MSTQAIEPPPAPMVWISIIGVRTTRPKSMLAWAVSTLSPPAISATSKLVPPMSPVITSAKPAALGDVGGGDDAGGRAGKGGAHRQAAGRGGIHDAAVRLDDQELACEAVGRKRLVEPAQIARDLRLQIGVESGGREALELADLGQDLVRCGDMRVGPECPQRCDGGAFIGRVGVGVDEEDGDGGAAGLQQLTACGLDSG